jgi:hypothetical protein
VKSIGSANPIYFLNLRILKDNFHENGRRVKVTLITKGYGEEGIVSITD